MYYEEKVIDGKLMCRFRPDGEWHEVEYKSLLDKYQNLKERNDKKYQEIQDLKESLRKLDQLAADCSNHKLFV
ncbi:hypothetical protein DYD21_20800 [Rhodohalobacter sp. SW132]|uniref:hypothetical protein n=1 Tax=Rhodohalobacter sp. SW132 TaxID=2293433 RepID=UPI000E258A83|nr:hypothetical protein [Rhodohalobacter sp. SW132]REL23908.1 hypothetical protein DYD21_20800 [Rhodohalobacter sp. SW132]